MTDLKAIATKWQATWKKERVFHVEKDDREKFYIAMVYPYMNGLLHVGHLYTYLPTDLVARYQRMLGKNVLIKCGFHCTGTPIVAAADRVKDGEEKQISILKQLGIHDKDIEKFADPLHWINYFPGETLKDYEGMGFAIDERYTFRTTDINPAYDAFIRWQFNQLKEKGYVKKGKHPVVWCPNCKNPTGDHARAEGEGETVKDFVWVKFHLKDSDMILMAGTTRPDALWGQTNIWLDPEGAYNVIEVQGEKWVVGEAVLDKVREQFGDYTVISDIAPKELFGKWAKGPLVDHEVYILPAWFIDANVGSGIVYSALEDPVDLLQLEKMQADTSMLEEFNLDLKVVEKLKPIPIIDVEGMGENLGKEIAEEFSVTSFEDKKKLEEAKGELNRRVFRKGIMKDTCGKYAGMKVPEAQLAIKRDLLKEKSIVMFYELSGKVICRCLTECIVKVVSDQWFIEYNDPDWKEKAHACLESMKIYPEKVRKQFDHVIDWLDHWACTREKGLGTRLPWDEHWLIESLSDSTIQMAYGTISKYLQHPKEYGFSIDKLNDAFFDYVLSGKGSAEAVAKETSIPKDIIETMREDFIYFYPFDFRNSGKDLVQNHLTFSMFVHTALFPKEQWPKAFMINGRVLVDNEKMSKSKGNFYTMRELYEEHGADSVRLTTAYAGEGVDDANFNFTFLETAKRKLAELHALVKEHKATRTERLAIDDWFEAKIHESIKKTTAAMNNMLFKSAVQHGFMDLQRAFTWYLRRTTDNPHKELMQRFLETQVKLLCPFIPHLAEECWSLLKQEGFASNASWPEYDEDKISGEQSEELIEQVLQDIRAVKKLAKVEQPKKVTLFIADVWKYDLFAEARAQNSANPKEVITALMKNAAFKKHGQFINKTLPKMVAARKLPELITHQSYEQRTFMEASEFLQQEIGCKIEVITAEASKEPKAQQALPGKPAMIIE